MTTVLSITTTDTAGALQVLAADQYVVDRVSGRIGLALGGVLGIGTVLYALAIGPITQLLLPLFLVDLAPRGNRP